MDKTERQKLRGHLLLPDDLKASLPPLYSQEDVDDKIVHVKFFHPQSVWTWFVIEGEQTEEGFMMFGYVVGQSNEWGYFNLEDLDGIGSWEGSRLIMPVERDLTFTPRPFSQVRK